MAFKFVPIVVTSATEIAIQNGACFGGKDLRHIKAAQKFFAKLFGFRIGFKVNKSNTMRFVFFRIIFGMGEALHTCSICLASLISTLC